MKPHEIELLTGRFQFDGNRVIFASPVQQSRMTRKLIDDDRAIIRDGLRRISGTGGREYQFGMGPLNRAFAVTEQISAAYEPPRMDCLTLGLFEPALSLNDHLP